MENLTNTDSSWTLLVDLFELTLKFLGRAAVQGQLLAVVLIALTAWLLPKLLFRWLDQRRAARPDAGGTQTAGPDQDPDAEYSELAEQMEAIEQGEDPDEVVVEPPQPTRWERFQRSAAGLLHSVSGALLAVALAYIVRGYFRQQGWFDGLLASAILFFWWFLAYRTLVGLLYTVLDDELIHRHHRRFLTPLAVVAVILAALAQLTQLSTLGSSLVWPQVMPSMTLGALFIATVGFYFWIALTLILQDTLQPILSSRQGSNSGATQATLTLWRYALMALGLVIVLRILGLDPTTVAAITGGLSIGIGFALQDVLKNFLGGIILLFEGTVRPGDWVEIGGTEGAVDKLNIRSTVVRTFDNVEYIVPNQDWLNSTVTTYTRASRRVRTRVPIGVSYDSDLRRVQEILLEQATNHPDVLQDPPPIAPMVNFGDSSVDFLVLAWVEDALYKGKVAGDLRFMIWDAFQEHGIEIPYPQQDIHIRSGLPEHLRDAQSDGPSGGDATGQSGRTSEPQSLPETSSAQRPDRAGNRD